MDRNGEIDMARFSVGFEVANNLDVEVLDFVVDCRSHKLVPRDPKAILTEIE